MKKNLIGLEETEERGILSLLDRVANNENISMEEWFRNLSGLDDCDVFSRMIRNKRSNYIPLVYKTLVNMLPEMKEKYHDYPAITDAIEKSFKTIKETLSSYRKQLKENGKRRKSALDEMYTIDAQIKIFKKRKEELSNQVEQLNIKRTEIEDKIREYEEV